MWKVTPAHFDPLYQSKPQYGAMAHLQEVIIAGESTLTYVGTNPAAYSIGPETALLCEGNIPPSSVGWRHGKFIAYVKPAFTPANGYHLFGSVTFAPSGSGNALFLYLELGYNSKTGQSAIYIKQNTSGARVMLGKCDLDKWCLIDMEVYPDQLKGYTNANTPINMPLVYTASNMFPWQCVLFFDNVASNKMLWREINLGSE